MPYNAGSLEGVLSLNTDDTRMRQTEQAACVMYALRLEDLYPARPENVSDGELVLVVSENRVVWITDDLSEVEQVREAA